MTTVKTEPPTPSLKDLVQAVAHDLRINKEDEDRLIDAGLADRFVVFRLLKAGEELAYG